MGPRDYESIAWVDGRDHLFAWLGSATEAVGRLLVRAGGRIASGTATTDGIDRHRVHPCRPGA